MNNRPEITKTTKKTVVTKKILEKSRPYNETELKTIKKNWNGEPPKCCLGNCKLTSGFMMVCCNSCGWDDY